MLLTENFADFLFSNRYCLEANNGQVIIPTSYDSLVNLVQGQIQLVSTKGIPSTTTWIAYFFFFFVNLLLAGFMPGITMEGLPTAPHGKRLVYLCNGYSCYYLTLLVLFAVHFMGIFPLTYLWDYFGECLIASMIIGDVTSLVWYLYGLFIADEYNGKQSWTGNVVYDFFMGSILYPRIGIVDIKMVAEVRWSWLTLMMITISCAAKQYEMKGFISGNMCFMLLAHWLYSNATVKGEHCIPCTWDMFHENFGWMLNFWNISGVPFLYCYQSLYVLKNQDLLIETYPKPLLVFNFILLVTAYYCWDTSNSQKANIKIRVKRNTFPQFSWGDIQEPIRFIETPHGNLLVDGWYAFVRKLQYTGDILMALSWGLACGFRSPLPYFYVFFFTNFVMHRQKRDEERCAQKYGKYWDEYVKKVPNVFIPSGAFFVWLFTGRHPDGDKEVQKRASEKKLSDKKKSK
jgi:delta24(24(1))-sterol reductase